MSPDASALSATHRKAFPAHEVWDAPAFAALLAQRGILLIGDAQSFVLGRIILDEAEILTLATHPDQRRRGLARTALDLFLTEARSMGAATVFLEVAETNLAARALYSGAGFAPVGRRPGYYHNPDGSRTDALLLKALLSG